MQTPTKSRRGLAAMSLKRRREIASLGGKAAHRLGVAYRWTSETARLAGRKGGRISRRRDGKRGVQ